VRALSQSRALACQARRRTGASAKSIHLRRRSRSWQSRDCHHCAPGAHGSRDGLSDDQATDSSRAGSSRDVEP